jgi:predicted PurR-regulated permease PerM
MIPIPLNTAGRIGLNVLLLLAGVATLHYGKSVIVPMLIALLLATVLGPAASWLHETFKMRWSLACVSVVIGLVLASALITAVFSGSVVRLVTQLSDEKKALKIFNDFRTKLEQVAPFELDRELFPKDPQTIDDVGVFRYLRDNAPTYILGEAYRNTRDWSWELIIILFTTFFVILEGKMLARRAVAIFGPSEEIQAKATQVLFEMANQVRIYLVWRTLINLVLAIVMGTIYSMVGLSQAWTWAILLAILNYIPYFGPVLASVPPFLDAFIFSGPTEAVVVTIAFWIAILVEGYLVVPLLMGRNMDLNATTVMLACLFWELVWGMTGLFLAMPIMAAIKAILYHVPEWRPWANLMSSSMEDDELGLSPPGHSSPAPLIPPAPLTESPNGMAGTPHADPVKTAEGETHGS